MTTEIQKTASQIAVMSRILELQRQMLAMPQAEVPSQFKQGAGIAAKTILLRKDTMAIGGLHKFDNMNIIHRGDITVTTDGAPVRYTVTDFPIIVVAPPCTKRAVFAHEDTYWTSLHVTDLTTEDEVRDEFIEKNEAEAIKRIGGE